MWVFSKNSWQFAISRSSALGCYWLHKNLPANRSDWALALRWDLWRSLTVMFAREGLQWIFKKTQFFLNTLYVCVCMWMFLSVSACNWRVCASQFNRYFLPISLMYYIILLHMFTGYFFVTLDIFGILFFLSKYLQYLH